MKNLISNKSKEIISKSKYREVYEMILQMPHTEQAYSKVVQVCSFMNSTDARMDMNIVDEIFADYLNDNNMNGGANND